MRNQSKYQLRSSQHLHAWGRALLAAPISIKRRGREREREREREKEIERIPKKKACRAEPSTAGNAL